MKAPHEINKNVSMQVSSAVMLAMEMKPEDRFQNIQDFRMALSMLSAPNPILEKPKTSDVQQPPKPKAVNKKSSGSSVLGGCLIAFLIFSLLGIIVTFVIIFALSAALDGSGSTQQDSSYEQETSISEPDQEKITNTSQEEPSYEKPDETNRPKIYNGVLAGNEITVKLNGFEDFIEGSYVYDVVGQSIKLEESYRNDEEIEIKEYTNGNYTGRFNFSFFNRNDDELDGTWTSTDGSSSYRVILYQR
jgi:hypothetical protein